MSNGFKHEYVSYDINIRDFCERIVEKDGGKSAAEVAEHLYKLLLPFQQKDFISTLSDDFRNTLLNLIRQYEDGELYGD